MPNELQGLLGGMQATPRNRLMGLLADGLKAADRYANKPDPTMPGGKANPPLSLLSDLASLKSLAEVANNVSYGYPLTNKGVANVPFLKPETADALMMAPISPRNALAAAALAGGGDTAAMKAIFAGIGAKTADKALAKAPQAEALAIAQRNAAKPIAEGGLGLHPNNTAAERAQAMGFTESVYHGTRTPEPIREFVPGGASGSTRSGDAYGVGVYTSTDPATASNKVYTGETGGVMPLLLNRGNHLNLDAPSAQQLETANKFMAAEMLPSDKARFPANIKQAKFTQKELDDAKEFFRNQQANADQFGAGYERTQPWIDKDEAGNFVINYTDFNAPVSIKTGADIETALKGVGYDSVPLMGFEGHTMRRNSGEQWDVTTNPARLRSRFAAFDPFQRNSANILAGVGAGGLGLSLLFNSERDR